MGLKASVRDTVVEAIAWPPVQVRFGLCDLIRVVERAVEKSPAIRCRTEGVRRRCSRAYRGNRALRPRARLPPSVWHQVPGLMSGGPSGPRELAHEEDGTAVHHDADHVSSGSCLPLRTGRRERLAAADAHFTGRPGMPCLCSGRLRMSLKMPLQELMTRLPLSLRFPCGSTYRWGDEPGAAFAAPLETDVPSSAMVSWNVPPSHPLPLPFSVRCRRVAGIGCLL